MGAAEITRSSLPYEQLALDLTRIPKQRAPTALPPLPPKRPRAREARPVPGCDYTEWPSEEDPDCTLSLMVAHLTGFFPGQHRLGQVEAMRWLARVQEVRR